MKQFQYCVAIGRYQPFHYGHYEVIREALSLAETVLIVIGSASKAPSIQNPWTSAQRESFIRLALAPNELARVKFIHIRDYYYLNNRWLAEVQQAVSEATDGADDESICNIGQVNDFPQWKFIKMRVIDRLARGTVIRGLYFTHDVAYKNHIAEVLHKELEDFKKTKAFENLKEEYDFIRNYKASWQGSPFPVTFVTVDAVVVKSGHVLLVRRKGNPGRGLIALPGGFLNQKETILDGAIRELKEETAIKLSKEELEKSIVEQKVFDYPERSNRGRTITNAFLIDLGNGPLPQVKGMDDADKAFWLSLSDISNREADFFEDHFHIVSHFTSKF